MRVSGNEDLGSGDWGCLIFIVGLDRQRCFVVIISESLGRDFWFNRSLEDIDECCNDKSDTLAGNMYG